MEKTVLQKKEERGQLVKEMEKMTVDINKDLDNRSDKKWTNDENIKFEKLDNRQNELLNEIDIAEKSERVSSLMQRAKNPENNIEFPSSYRQQEITREDRQNAFKGFLAAAGGKKLHDWQRNAADKVGQHLGAMEDSFEVRQTSFGTGSEGGFLANQGSTFVGIEKNIARFADIKKIASVQQVENGQDKHYAYVDTTGSMGAIVAEHGTLANTDTTFSKVLIESHMFTSNSFPISWRAINDLNYDVLSLVEEICGERIGRKFNDVATTGSGTSEPYGYITEAGTGYTAASTTAVTYGDLVELMGSVQDYADNAHWQMNSTTLTVLRKLVDGNGRPLFYGAGDSLASGFGQSLLGHPISLNNAMADLAEDSKSIAFGDFSKVKVYDSSKLNVQVLKEKYADDGALGVICHQFSGVRLVNANAIKVLEMAAS